MRVRGIVAVLLAIAVILSSCNPGTNPEANNAPGPENSTDDGVVTIGFAANEFREEEYAPLIEQFNSENSDVQVQFVSLDLATEQGQPLDSSQRLRQTASAADTIATNFYVDNPEQVNTSFYDLTSLMDADATFNPDDYYPAALESTNIAGGMYWLPTEINLTFLNYNKDLWDERNLPPPDPNWNWTDLTGALEQLAEKNGSTVNIYGMADGSQGALVLLGLLEETNLDLWNTTPEDLRIDDPAIVGAIEQLQSLAEQGAIYAETPEEGAQFPQEEVEQQVSDGNVGMWMSNSFSSEMDNNITFEVGYAAIPPLALGLWDASYGYAISSGTEHPEAAWRWLSFLSQQTPMNDFWESDSGMIDSVYARQSLTEQSDSWNQLNEEQQMLIQATLDQSAEATINNSGPLATMEILFQALPTLLNGEQDAETALREVQADLDERLAQVELTPTAVPDTGPIVISTPVPNTAPDGATTLRFGAFSGDDTAFQQAALAFQEDNPDIFIEVVGREAFGNEYDSETLASSADCFISTSYVATDTDMATAMLDLQPLIDADASFSQDDYPPAFLAPFQDESALHGLPYTIQFEVLSYNQTAFEAAGLEAPQIDWTMDDFLAAVEQLDTGQGENRQYGFAITNSQASEALFLLERLGVSLTTQNADNVYEPNFTDPEVIEGVKFLVDLIKNYTPHTEIQGYKSHSSYGDDTYQLMTEGRISMWLSGGFGFANTNESEFTTAIAPKPLGERAISPRDFFATGLFISAQTEQPDACWRWLKHLSTQMVETYSGAFPARRSVIESESFAAQASPGTVEVYEAYSDALERTPNNDTIGRPIEFYWFFQALDRAVQGEDLEQALADAQVTTEDYLACAQQNNNDQDGSCLIQVDPDYEGTRVMSTPVPEDDP
ncbi:MAG: extracellular solute-binding protein [Chloroflexota bacterium]